MAVRHVSFLEVPPEEDRGTPGSDAWGDMRHCKGTLPERVKGADVADGGESTGVEGGGHVQMGVPQLVAEAGSRSSGPQGRYVAVVQAHSTAVTGLVVTKAAVAEAEEASKALTLYSCSQVTGKLLHPGNALKRCLKRP